MKRELSEATSFSPISKIVNDGAERWVTIHETCSPCTPTTILSFKHTQLRSTCYLWLILQDRDVESREEENSEWIWDVNLSSVPASSCQHQLHFFQTVECDRSLSLSLWLSLSLVSILDRISFLLGEIKKLPQYTISWLPPLSSFQYSSVFVNYVSFTLLRFIKLRLCGELEIPQLFHFNFIHKCIQCVLPFLLPNLYFWPLNYDSSLGWLDFVNESFTFSWKIQECYVHGD